MDNSIQEDMEDYELGNENEIAPADGIMDGEITDPHEISPIIAKEEFYFPSYVQRFKRMTVFEVLMCVYIIAALLCLTVVSCLVIGSGWLLFGPVLILLTVFLTTFYRDHQEGRFNCCFNTCNHVRDKVFGEIKY